MELIVKTPTFPEVISFNYEELKQEITNKTSHYMNLVYTEDQIQEAKKDVAALRKFTKAMSDERIKIKKECLKPYEDFEAKIKELDAIVSTAICNIDVQIKGFEEQKKKEKQAEVESYFENTNSFDWLKLEQIFSDKWLNASVNIKTVCTEMDARLEQIAKDLETLSNLPEFSFEAIEEYKQSLDLNKAITEGMRLSEIQKRKAEAARETVKMPDGSVYVQDEDKQGFHHYEPTENKQWISFKAHLTVDDANELRNFFNSRNIEFEAV